jgi:hypothetical protein
LLPGQGYSRPQKDNGEMVEKIISRRILKKTEETPVPETLHLS